MTNLTKLMILAEGPGDSYIVKPNATDHNQYRLGAIQEAMIRNE